VEKVHRLADSNGNLLDVA